MTGDTQSNTFRQLIRFVEIAARRDNRKFFSAIAAQQIVRTEDAADLTSYFLQNVVTATVAVGVIDGLEVVDINHDDAERFTCSVRAEQFPFPHCDAPPIIPL